MTAVPGTTDLAWPYCGEGASADDQTGCRGIRVGGGERCLRHMPNTDRAAYLGALSAGSELDLRGTSIDEDLLHELRMACTDPSTQRVQFGQIDFTQAVFTGNARFTGTTFTGFARFDSATFTHHAWFGWSTFASGARFESVTFADSALFESVTFTYNARFDLASFSGEARFVSATFNRDAEFFGATFISAARFDRAAFKGAAWFNQATFHGTAGFESVTCNSAWFDSVTFAGATNFRSAAFTHTAEFDRTTFSSLADFQSATFTYGAKFGATFSVASFTSASFAGEAWFVGATFTKNAGFDSATFTGDARFDSATFMGLQHLGPLVCAGRISLDRARFSGPQATIEASSASATYERTVFEGSVVLRLRYASLQLSRATLSGPTAVQTWPVPFTASDGALDESLLTAGNAAPDVRLTSLEGVDAAQLVLTDVDLTNCEFTGAFHLDQIQIGLGCRFSSPPAGWRRRGVLPTRWSPRKVLAEEQHWRAQAGGAIGQGWLAGPHHAAPERGAGPEDLTGVYQQLRKAFEEAGNEPDAADFYYGEMEMRRRDVQRPRAERRLLWLYWLASGYGLRASRALSWLVAAMGVTLLLMMLFGLPNDAPDPQTSGTYSAGVVQVTTKTPDPALSLPVRKRVTAARAEKAALVVVNSVVFRSSGQNLTLPGTVIEMASRISEPVLLGLSALAVRSRVKR